MKILLFSKERLRQMTPTLAGEGGEGVEEEQEANFQYLVSLKEEVK
jgi:hypothetical protein